MKTFLEFIQENTVPDWLRFNLSQQKPIKVDPSVLEKNSQLKQKASQIGVGIGWKIHLTTGFDDQERMQAAQEIEKIRNQSRIPFKYKVLSGGEAGNKDITVYVGPKRATIEVATLISNNQILRKILKSPSKEVIEDDIEIIPGIYARFDVGSIDDRFHQYNCKGWGMRMEDASNMTFGGKINKTEACKLAYDSLKDIYGDVFTG